MAEKPQPAPGRRVQRHQRLEVHAELGAGMSFEVPWLTLDVIFLVVYAVALATTYAPAVRASRIYPAEALRYQ